MDIELQTPRLVLRPHRLADFAQMLALWRQPGVTRHTLGRPITEEECWHRLLRYAGHWALAGHGMFVVERAGVLAGEVGVMDFRRGLGPDFDGYPEAGWMLGDAHLAQGLASEALEAVLGWTGDRLGPRTVCFIREANAPSLRLAARVGFTPFQKTDHHGHRVILHERHFPSVPETR